MRDVMRSLFVVLSSPLGATRIHKLQQHSTATRRKWPSAHAIGHVHSCAPSQSQGFNECKPTHEKKGFHFQKSRVGAAIRQCCA
ncbi:hypothetical protein B0J12DRAFT_651074 [Macrophomina phaseolina]|uniref:Secreted protein n=1 Tax=Macrophomina phaseolina TaxID=35725 RepID=A0ABQ8GMF0_9PEZI|nr:hypothetical protein B0J12DRAFT_651074 [Macrophomina phaseolina]